MESPDGNGSQRDFCQKLQCGTNHHVIRNTAGNQRHNQKKHEKSVPPEFGSAGSSSYGKHLVYTGLEGIHKGVAAIMRRTSDKTDIEYSESGIPVRYKTVVTVIIIATGAGILIQAHDTLSFLIKHS
jgi:hypothetical protein